ncbi:MAG TPA: hypothetical protein VH853_03150 [Polyangia bacterium]|jgi:hypothetical protein|nr:hypothetical protein [Polyangia bacterium]
MCVRAVLVTVVAAGLFVCVAAPARAAGDEPPANDATAPIGAPVEPIETATVQAPPPVEAAPPKPIPELDERTAYLVGKHTLKLGVLAFEFGILQQLSIGTEPPAWLLRTVIDILVPNLHLKYQVLDRDPVAVAVLVAGYYASLNRDSISGNLIDIPLSAFVSVKVHPRITLHAEGTYVYARVVGTGDVTQASLNGATAANAGQVGLMLQYRLTRIFSLTATGRYQFYVSDLPLSGSATIDPYTTGSLNGQYVPAVQHPWEAIGGVAFLWHYFHLIVGAGYGYYFVPGLDIANPKRTIVPDADLAVVL